MSVHDDGFWNTRVFVVSLDPAPHKSVIIHVIVKCIHASTHV